MSGYNGSPHPVPGNGYNGAPAPGNGNGGSFDPTPTPEEQVLATRRILLERAQNLRDDLVAEVQTAPIFTESIRAVGATLFSQFGLIAGDAQFRDRSEEMVYYNVAAPSSTFICGSQGSGKSHTLSCLLENCLLQSVAGVLPRPLTAIVFHYDTFTSDVRATACEAAHLASSLNIKVRVLCAPTNIGTMTRTYAGMNIVVEPLRISEKDLDTNRMMSLMSVKGASQPLYMAVVTRILKELRIKYQKTPGAQFSYREFTHMLQREELSDHQRVPLDQRLENLESFMALNGQAGNDWTPRAGQLTIVDLSCPCVTPEGACQLFNICLTMFLEGDKSIGRVVALDEAHKYMTDYGGDASSLTDNLLSTIRLQRHLAARIIISTQEPTISPKLLDLCSVTIVHRFTSPEWLRVLQKHLAVTSGSGDVQAVEGGGDQNGGLFGQIVDLRVGEALLFAPSAIFKPTADLQGVIRLSGNWMKIRIRKRITMDGGKSIMAA